MRRRTFITLLGGATAASPFATYAQRAERVWRVGWLSPAPGPGPLVQSFLQGMQERGYVEGKSLTIEYRWSAGKSEPLEQLAAELVREASMSSSRWERRRPWPQSWQHRPSLSSLQPLERR